MRRSAGAHFAQVRAASSARIGASVAAIGRCSLLLTSQIIRKKKRPQHGGAEAIILGDAYGRGAIPAAPSRLADISSILKNQFEAGLEWQSAAPDGTALLRAAR
jgi:hypothetical protein